MQVWDGKEAITSAFQRASITTYVRDKLEVRSNCSRWDVSCPLPLWSPVAESKFYVAGVETHDLVIEHAAESKLVPGMNGRGSGLRGNIKCANGTVQPFTRRVELHELLSCAGVHSLDDDSDDPRGLREKKQKEVRRHKDTQQGKPAKSKRRSFRARGLVLHLSIEYTNLADTWVLPGEPTYTITVRHMPQLSYVNTVVLSRSGVYDDLSVRGVNSMFPNMTEEEAAACNGSETRVIRKSSAVHLELEQGGRMGRFTVASFVTALVTVATLGSIPWLVVDFILYALSYVEPPTEDPLPVAAQSRVGNMLLGVRRRLIGPGQQAQQPEQVAHPHAD